MEEFIKSIKPDTTPFDTFRERVIEECNVSRQTWYNWSKGLTVEAKYKLIINRIATEMFGKPVFTDEEKQSGCPTCPVKQYPACDKGIPCCQCKEESCNGRQPCPKKADQ